MERKNQKNLCIALSLSALFALWTLAVSLIDVRQIGPLGSSVGFSALNGFVHRLTGVNMTLYAVTDWLGLVPICFILGFAVLGLIQLLRRKSLFKVDYSILVLGGYYILVMTAYLLFEAFAVNYRPVLIDGFLEASYPSSTTMLVLCVMSTAMMQLKERIRNKALKFFAFGLISVFTVFMVAGRLLSGVHWFTDIIGGILLSAGLVMLYYYICNLKPLGAAAIS